MHRRALIISIGDELTVGATLDTNAQLIAQRLTHAGLQIIGHVTVPDDAEEIGGAISDRWGDADIVVCTGGLGPTADDLTRQGLANFVEEPLVEDAEALAQVEAWFARARRPMPDANRVQALRPRSAQCLRNDRGTAPGLHLSADRYDVYCLPGPPREMIPMLEAFVLPAIKTDRVVVSRVLRCYGIGESDLAGRLGELMDRDRNPLVGTTASGSVVSIRIRYEGDAPNADLLVDHAAKDAASRAAPFVFGEGEATLAGVLIDELRARGERLATVESCTGGLLGVMLTETPGASDVYVGGWVTYTNEMKQAQVGVPAAVFQAVGAVSRECAVAMAGGGLERADVDHALAITGIAGPGGGSDDKPVGTVWIALASRGAETDVRHFRMTGERENVRQWSAMAALGMLRLRLIGRDDVKLPREIDEP